MIITSKDDSPVISVIVPVYNVEQYVAECLVSIISQDFQDMEILVIDDGSTDGSLAVVESFAKIDSRVHVFHKGNGGLSDARNYGLDRAKGDFITFVDSDDVLLRRDIYSSIIPLFSENKELDVVQYRVIHEWGSDHSYIPSIEVKEYSDKEDITTAYLRQQIHVSFCDKFFRAKVFEKIRFPKGAISEDIATIPQLINQINKIQVTDIGFYGYRYREGSISTSTHNYSKTLSQVESNYIYYNYAYSFDSLKKECIVQYCPRVWNMISFARKINKGSDVIRKDLFLNLSLKDYLRYMHGLPLSFMVKVFLMFVVNPKYGLLLQKIFTKSL